MKTKALISFAVTAKLICVFVFVYAKSRFSHDAAPFIYIHTCTMYICNDVFLCSGYISKRKLAFNLTTIKELIVEAMQSITRKHWSDCIDHVKGIEVSYWASDIARDEMPDHYENMPILYTAIFHSCKKKIIFR